MLNQKRLAVAAWIVTGLLAGGCAEAGAPQETVRPVYCAGTWYPGDAETLAGLVDDLLEKASPPELAGKPVALIAPHAGYRFSAPTAAAAYGSLRGHSYKRAIVLAISHRYGATYSGLDVPDKLTAYETPLGPVPIDREACDRLLREDIVDSHANVDKGEHSLELQLPFLQRVLGELQLVPILVGQMSLRDFTAAAQAILPLVDEQTLVVVSSDFTHFGAGFGYQPFTEDVPEKLRELGDQAMAPLRSADFDGFAEHLARTKDTICGRGPILLLLRMLSMRGGATGVRAGFETSGEITGDWTTSVSYQSIVFTPPPKRLNEQERTTLLELARRTVTAHLNGRELPRPESGELSAGLLADGASFVTLENRGNLRGCIGNMVANGPLYESVIRNSVAACQDYRFKRNPVTAGEVDELHLEVSYLTPMKRIRQPEEIVVGRDGLLIAAGRQHGVLLPQVAYELGWTREEFLAQVCLKAGLPVDTWKLPGVELYTFEAEVFSEPEGGAH